MPRTMTILGILALAGVAAAFTTDREAADEAAVREAVQYYIDGQAAADGSLIARAFHPDARLTGVRNGALRTIPIAEYVGWFDNQPAADEAERERWIEEVDITGDAALVKVVLDYPQIRYTDYMSLLKLDGTWQIVHKNYTAERK